MSNIETKEQSVNPYEARLTEVESAINSPEKQDAFIKQTIEKFDSETDKKQISLFANNIVEGPINSQTEIKRNMMVDGFQLDDPNLYREMLGMIKTFKETPGWGDLPTRAIVPTAIQFAIDRYYGNTYSDQNTEMANRKFYMDHSTDESENIHLSELKGKKIAVCAEKAAAAQNLASFVGLKSFLINSRNSKLHGENGPEEAHMYNVISTDNGNFLYDPANPVHDLVESSNSPTIRPAMYKLSQEEFEGLKSGGAVTVEHEDKYIDQDKGLIVNQTQRIYTGPK